MSGMLASNGEAPVSPALFWPGFFPVLSFLVTYSKGVERYVCQTSHVSYMHVWVQLCGGGKVGFEIRDDPLCLLFG